MLKKKEKKAVFMDIRNIINESIDKAFQELKENKDNYKINQDIINSSNLLLIIRNKKIKSLTALFLFIKIII